jgi:hypothetical protein
MSSGQWREVLRMRGLERLSLRVVRRGKRGESMFESISRVKCLGLES